jgi:hypothetical protein
MRRATASRVESPATICAHPRAPVMNSYNSTANAVSAAFLPSQFAAEIHKNGMTVLVVPMWYLAHFTIKRISLS